MKAETKSKSSILLSFGIKYYQPLNTSKLIGFFHPGIIRYNVKMGSKWDPIVNILVSRDYIIC